MIGNVTITGTTYRQFTARVRRRLPTATKEEIYRQWCREDCDDANEAAHAIAAEREKIRKAKITSREFNAVQPAVGDLCDLVGTTRHAGEFRRILVNLLRTTALAASTKFE